MRELCLALLGTLCEASWSKDLLLYEANTPDLRLRAESGHSWVVRTDYRPNSKHVFPAANQKRGWETGNVSAELISAQTPCRELTVVLSCLHVVPACCSEATVLKMGPNFPSS